MGLGTIILTATHMQHDGSSGSFSYFQAASGVQEAAMTGAGSARVGSDRAQRVHVAI